MDYKKHYQLFLKSNEGLQHYASHSHHYWPDVTRTAMLQYWDDSAKYVDEKWDYFFSNKIPSTQKLIARHLSLKNPEQIVFAPNTHEFVYRLLSIFDPRKKIKVLTTDSEFYSFDRQVNRMQEDQLIEVIKISVEPFATFTQRFIAEIKSQKIDFIFLSHVFFNSGIVVQGLEKIVNAASSETMIAIDGYHSFMAVPTDLSHIQDRVFYIAGSYKYAQGGEGCCFMVVPKQSVSRPLYTGWFAGFSNLAKDGGAVLYSADGYRFAGSTMDFSALYRLEAVLKLFEKENITVATIHTHVQSLQKKFLNDLEKLNHPILNKSKLLSYDLNQHGHFLTFELGDAALTKKLHKELNAQKIKTDFRGTRLRFGFGLYQESHINWGEF